MNYLVAVLPDRSQAEAAYSALEKEGTGELIDRATRVLRQFEPENIQGYNAPIGT
jgi:hypothetical protein